MPTTQMLAMTEGAGGLFDFNATLPLMAIQFVLLMVVLTFIFYKPVSKVLDDRENYISGNLTQASEKLIKADELYKQYRWLLNVETDRSNEDEREGLLYLLEYMLDQMNWGRR